MAAFRARVPLAFIRALYGTVHDADTQHMYVVCSTVDVYSTVWTHRNRLAGGSQSISKCAREIGPTVSQFLNVHGKFSESGSVLGYL